MCVSRSRTAEQGLVASVGGGQRAETLLPLVQDSAQVTRVAQAAHCHAVQVNRLHEVTEQRPLQAQDVPPSGQVRGERGREEVERHTQTR